MLKRLKQDHKNIAILLNILAEQSNKLAIGEGVNYRVILDVVDYMLSYAEHSHHPIEDIVYGYLTANSGLQGLSDRMLKEHKHLSEVTKAFHVTLTQVLTDHLVPQDKIRIELEEFILLQRTHMQFEEEEIFPLMSQYIDSDTWDKLADRCQKQLADDPLFSDNIKQECEELRALVEASELN